MAACLPSGSDGYRILSPQPLGKTGSEFPNGLKTEAIFLNRGKEAHFAVQGLDLTDDFYTLIAS